MTGQVRRVEYRYNIRNLNDFMIAWIFGNFFTWQKMLGAAIVAAIISGITWLGDPSRFKSTTLLGTLVLASAFYFIALPIVSWFATLLTLGLGKQRMTVRTTDITSAEIVSSALGTQVTMKWSAIHRVHITRNTILIFTNRNCAYIIPKSAFTTPEAADVFATAAQTYWQDSRTVTSVF